MTSSTRWTSTATASTSLVTSSPPPDVGRSTAPGSAPASSGTARNPTKCIVGWSGLHNCACVHDFETGITHLPAACAPPADLETLFAQLRAAGVAA